MEQMVFQLIWLCIYWYYVEQTGSIEKGTGKRMLGFCLTAAVLLSSIWIPLCMTWGIITGIFMLYDLFFDGEAFRRQWWRIMLPGICIAVGALIPAQGVFVLHGWIMLVFLLLLAQKRESLRAWNGMLTAVSYGMISVFLWLVSCTGKVETADSLQKLLLWGGVLLEALLFLAVEGTLFFYKKGFDFRTEQFRTELMEHQYGEIRSVYMDMRGWRHDYHNHMQVMKAQLALGNLEEIREYLDKLEQELDRVDTFVRSGNLMVDAILNSKLTLARRQVVAVNCKVKVPERLSVEDVDLCVILGNLLDNALEACALVEKESRFLRIYMTVNKSQLYLSVQNAAKEEPDFEARNYITRKRGNHGLGMKRVQTAVEKYSGYLHLANEPGIFAAEVTMPLQV